MNFLVMVNANFLWAVNVEREMLQRKLKGIVKHQHVLKEEVREPIKKVEIPHLGASGPDHFPVLFSKTRAKLL